MLKSCINGHTVVAPLHYLQWFLNPAGPVPFGECNMTIDGETRIYDAGTAALELGILEPAQPQLTGLEYTWAHQVQ